MAFGLSCSRCTTSTAFLRQLRRLRPSLVAVGWSRSLVGLLPRDDCPDRGIEYRESGRFGRMVDMTWRPWFRRELRRSPRLSAFGLIDSISAAAFKASSQAVRA